MSGSRAKLLYGTDEQPAASRTLRAGSLTADLSDGNLRAICWHGKEAIRAISYLVRDENWGTYAPTFFDLAVNETEGAFHVSYGAACRAPSGTTLTYRAVIEGTADGRLSFDVTATPDGDFSTNRCGFNILHPIIGVAGEPAQIEHVDGSVEESRFPAEIDPAQPFMQMREIAHTVAPEVTATCRMEGDAFEMEDQRNWTDASYKTYVRPLALPWPYTLPANETLRQTITLTLDGAPAAASDGSSGPVAISLGEADGTAPAFGFVITPEETGATLAAIDRLREIAPQHLILHYNPLEGHGVAALRHFADLLAAYPAEATLEFVLPCRESPSVELHQAAKDVVEAGLRLAALAVSPAPDLKSTPPGSKWPDCPPLDEVYRAARNAFPGLTLGGGMFSYFTELNRKRVTANLLDFITHSTSPLVHAADDRSVMETLEAMPFVTRSVRAIFGDKPYRIGPSAIGMRHNPYGARLAENPDAKRRVTMTADDPRQKGLFAAAWMVGYAASVADARLTHLTLGALTGPFGVLDQNGLRPAFLAARALAALAGKPLRIATSADPSRILAVAAGDIIVIANLTPEPVEVGLPGHSEIAVLDEGNAAEALRDGRFGARGVDDRITLDAYGIAVAAKAGAS
jgi:hypothetical protein